MNLRSTIGRFVGILALAALAAFPLGCSRQAGNDKIATGKVIDRTEVVQKLILEGVPVFNIELSSFAYAEVNEQSIPGLVADFRSALFKAGVPVSDVTGQSGYDQRFNCTGFSDFFAGYSSARLMGELWHSPLQVQRSAVFVVWFTQDAAPVDAQGRKIGHAINLLLTQNGARWLEPQTGAKLTLSVTERSTVRARA